MLMKIIDEAHARKGKVKAFTSLCEGLPSPLLQTILWPINSGRCIHVLNNSIISIL
jgi:hypothetical protein